MSGSEFETEVTITASIEQSSLSEARSEIEDALTADPITVDVSGGGGGLMADGGRSGGGLSGLRESTESLVTMAEDRNTLLGEMLEAMDAQAFETAQGGGGGGGAGILPAGLASSVGGGVAGGVGVGLAGAFGTKALAAKLEERGILPKGASKIGGPFRVGARVAGQQVDRVTSGADLSVGDIVADPLDVGVADVITGPIEPTVSDLVAGRLDPGVEDLITAPADPTIPDFITGPTDPGVPDFITGPFEPALPDLITAPVDPGIPDFITEPLAPTAADFITEPLTPRAPDVIESAVTFNPGDVVADPLSLSPGDVVDQVQLGVDDLIDAVAAQASVTIEAGIEGTLDIDASDLKNLDGAIERKVRRIIREELGV